jgi:anti-sigma regulatory factor (Ser/Thr protein kinase)
LVAELSLQIAGGPDAPSEARSALRRFHPELPAEVMQLVVLLASELVSNAVKHAAAELVKIRFQVIPEHVRVEVEDEGPGFEPIALTPQPGTIGGWGLHLVDELSSRWGVMDAEGARVWFEIDR